MNRSVRARWFNAAAFAFLAVVQFITAGPGMLSRLVIPGLLLAVAAVLSPLRPAPANNISQAEAARLITDTDAHSHTGRRPVVIYHRPGCTFCARLRLALTGRRSRAYWVDIWADDEAAAYVRMVNDGNETVPTVVIDGVRHTNPDPSLVKSAVG